MKNEGLDKNVITNETEKILKSETWITIGGKKKWKRYCSECNNVILFSTKGNYISSLKNECMCRSCSNKLKRWTEKNRKIIRKCLNCSNDTVNKKFCSRKCFVLYKLKTTKRRVKARIFNNINKNKVCEKCGVLYYSSNKLRRFCSRKCFNLYKYDKNIKICKFCKKSFHVYKQNLKFCSNKCKYLSMKHPPVFKNCRWCGKSFLKDVDNGHVKFCCHMCSVIYQLNTRAKTKPEQQVETILKVNNIRYTYGFVLENKIYDFYIKEKSLLIEVDGVYWHGKDKTKLNDMQIKNIKNDKYKDVLAKKHGYRLIRIWEDEIDSDKLIKFIK